MATIKISKFNPFALNMHYHRVGVYQSELATGSVDPLARPEVLRESASTALVDGRHAWGVVVADFCMGLAVRKARETGVGWVAARWVQRGFFFKCCLVN